MDPQTNSTPPESPKPKLGVKLDAATVAKPFRDEIKAKVQKLKDSGLEPPLLVGILANDDPAALKYAEWTGRACRNDGLRYELRKVEDAIDVERVLQDANDDPLVHGIIVYYPIFGMAESFSGESQDDYLRDSVSLKCDVEGLCHTYRSNLYRNVRYLDQAPAKKCLLPCTALSVAKILESVPNVYDATKPVGRRLQGHTVTIVNRSEIVGRPLAAMLANDGADVYSVDLNSIYLFKGGQRRLTKCEDGLTPEDCVRRSSVVVTGVPTKNYRLPTDWINENTAVINVASFKNVDADQLLLIPGVTYVSAVGKVTVAMLERNLMRLFDNFHHPQLRYRTAEEHELQKERTTIPPQPPQPWYGNTMQIYIAVTITALLAMSVLKSGK